jgi:hypothetical protein
MEHYIIRDIHGHYDTLMKLVTQLPSDAKLIFVVQQIGTLPQEQFTSGRVYFNAPYLFNTKLTKRLYNTYVHG